MVVFLRKRFRVVEFLRAACNLGPCIDSRLDVPEGAGWFQICGVGGSIVLQVNVALFS